MDTVPEHFRWDSYGIDWEGSEAAELWDRKRVLAFLDEMLAKALDFVGDGAGLLGEDVQPRFFLSRLDHLCYALRHVSQHTGEINALLRQAGVTGGSWL